MPLDPVANRAMSGVSIDGERGVWRGTANKRGAKVLGIEDGGEIVHVEFETATGETVAGIYELIGWTQAPKAVKLKVEQELLCRKNH